MKTSKSYLLFLLLFYTCAIAQVKNEMLFEETRITLNNALDKNAQILSFLDFSKSTDHYKKAVELFKYNESSVSITNELEKSIALLTIINEEIERYGDFFNDVLSSRKNALLKSADRYSPYYWNLAEENLFDAIEEYKDRNYKKASSLISTVTGNYSRASTYAEKVNNLLNNWDPIKSADNSIAFLLSPNNFSEGLNNYFKAIEMLSDRKELNTINEKISEAAKYFNLSTSVAKDFAKVYTSSITSREEARNAGAEKYAAIEWQNAEEILIKAGREFEDKDYDSAKEYTAEAVQKYKISRLTAVKERFLFTPRQKIELAKENDSDDYAPKSYDNSVKFYYQAEKLIASDRYTETEVASMAKQSEYEADKAYWITRVIKSVKKGDATWEDIILKWNVYDSNLERPEATERKDFVKIESLEKPSIRKISKYIPDESYLGRYAEINMEIFEEGDKILLRVYNINFKPVGWQLNDEAKNVLNQLVIALEDLKGSQYQISSYTDAVGAQRMNIEISESRAKTILDYLKEHSNYLLSKTTSAGYGEINPIADNNNFEGRRKNNRIEILISD
jgi:outer membrane protein OmpA-like peptidoglycan-associated protein